MDSTHGARGKSSDRCMAQAAVMRRALQLIDLATVSWTAEVPRVVKCDLRSDKFRSLWQLMEPAVGYYHSLVSKYSTVWAGAGH